MNRLPDVKVAHETSVMNELRALRVDVAKLTVALVGDEVGNKGLVARMAEAEANITVHDKKFLIWGTRLTLLGVVALFLKEVLMGWFLKKP